VREHFVDLSSDEEFATMGKLMNAVADHLLTVNPAFEDIRTNAT
jgi:hypothetical protein